MVPDPFARGGPRVAPQDRTWARGAGEPGIQLRPAAVVAEARAPLDPSHCHVVEGVQGIEVSLAGRGGAQNDGTCRVPHFDVTLHEAAARLPAGSGVGQIAVIANGSPLSELA